MYRNTPWCIVKRRRAEGRAVSRPRPRHGQVRAQLTPTIRQPVRCDTAMEASDTARKGAGQGAQGRVVRCARHGAQGARVSVATQRLGLRYGRGPRPRYDQAAHDTAKRAHSWASRCAPGCAAGPAGCGLGALSLL